MNLGVEMGRARSTSLPTALYNRWWFGPCGALRMQRSNPCRQLVLTPQTSQSEPVADSEVFAVNMALLSLDLPKRIVRMIVSSTRNYLGQ